MAWSVTVYDRSGNYQTYYDLIDFSITAEGDASFLTLPYSQLSIRINAKNTAMIDDPYKIEITSPYHTYFFVQEYKIEFDICEIKACSMIGLLDKISMPMEYMNNDPFSQMLTIISNFCPDFNVDSTTIPVFSVKGFFPEQTARERLQSLCLISGYYPDDLRPTVKFGLLYDITGNEEQIPDTNVYYKPQIVRKKPYNKVRVRKYSFTKKNKEELEAGDEYVYTRDWQYVTVIKQGGQYTSWEYIGNEKYYKYTHSDSDITSESTLGNENELFIDLMCINSTDAPNILSNISTRMFGNKSVEVQIKSEDATYYMNDTRAINTGDEVYIGYLTKANIIPGNSYGSPYTHDNAMFDCLFDFGNVVPSGMLIVRFIYGETVLGGVIFKEIKYRLPMDYNYDISIGWEDFVNNGRRVVAYPLDDVISGVIEHAEWYEDAFFDHAIVQELSTGHITVYRVDNASMSGNDLIIG